MYMTIAKQLHVWTRVWHFHSSTINSFQFWKANPEKNTVYLTLKLPEVHYHVSL